MTIKQVPSKPRSIQYCDFCPIISFLLHLQFYELEILMKLYYPILLPKSCGMKPYLISLEELEIFTDVKSFLIAIHMRITRIDFVFPSIMRKRPILAHIRKASLKNLDILKSLTCYLLKFQESFCIVGYKGLWKTWRFHSFLIAIHMWITRSDLVFSSIMRKRRVSSISTPHTIYNYNKSSAYSISFSLSIMVYYIQRDVPCKCAINVLFFQWEIQSFTMEWSREIISYLFSSSLVLV